MHIQEPQAGSTLFLSILLISIVLVLGINISTIAFKELRFSAFGRDSQKAFYAADTGAECALYHDYIEYAPDSAFPANPTETPSFIQCAGRSLTPLVVGTAASSSKSEFYLKFSNSDADPCVHVTVEKGDTDGDGSVMTQIESLGVDVSDKSATDCSAAASQTRRVQRAIRIRYGDTTQPSLPF